MYEFLVEADVETRLLALDCKKPNLVARLPGAGHAPPLLLYGHVDVVTTENQAWTQPPFSGKVADGCVGGRGTLDMKGGIAMMLAALLRAKAKGTVPAGDIVLALLSDKETQGGYGAKFLVESFPEQFVGVRHAIGKVGGFTMHINGQRLYPIMVA